MSVTQFGSSMNAAFGAVSAGGAGVPAFEVTQLTAARSAPLRVAVQPAGRPGAITPSKFCVKATSSMPRVNV